MKTANTLGRWLAAGALSLATASGGAVTLEPTQKLDELYTTDVVMADFDGDGDLDVLTSHYLEFVQLWLNDGIGQLSNSGQDLGNNYTNRIRLADVDSDGLPDMLLGGSSAVDRANADLLINDGAGNSTFTAMASFEATGNYVGDWGLADLDGQHGFDVVALTYDGSTSYLTVWLNPEVGEFAQSGNTSTQYAISSAQCTALGIAQLDGDTALDLVVGCRPYGDSTPGGVQVWEYDGSDMAASSVVLESGWDISDLGFADIDGNGHLDVIGTHFNSQLDATSAKDHSVWMNDGSALSAGTLDFNGQRLTTGDFNGDGFVDLVIADGSTVRQYAGTGNSDFTDQATVPTCKAYSGAVSLGDLNGDAKLDLVVASQPYYSSTEKNDLVLIQDAVNSVCPSNTGSTDSSGDGTGTDGTGTDDGSGTSSGGGGVLPIWVMAMLCVLLLRRRLR